MFSTNYWLPFWKPAFSVPRGAYNNHESIFRHSFNSLILLKNFLQKNLISFFFLKIQISNVNSGGNKTKSLRF
jgi:hypothetical protein